LFILMGSFATVAGIVSELFRTAYSSAPCVWFDGRRHVLGRLRRGSTRPSSAAVFTRMACGMTRFGTTCG
jgi:hypothetical protein